MCVDLVFDRSACRTLKLRSYATWDASKFVQDVFIVKFRLSDFLGCLLMAIRGEFRPQRIKEHRQVRKLVSYYAEDRNGDSFEKSWKSVDPTPQVGSLASHAMPPSIIVCYHRL